MVLLMIECHNQVRQVKHRVRYSVFIRFGERDRLEMADHLVSQVSHQTAAQGRKGFMSRRFVPIDEIAKCMQGIFGFRQIELVDLVPRNDCDAAIFAGDDLRGTQPDK